MATRCTTEVTVLDQTDATAVRCWYKMSASATLPAKPTTTDASATPSGWSRSEPTISSEKDAAKYVYSCWQTVWGDGTCDWGDVSMSASFEAAKVAYNTAYGTSQRLDNLSVGGRNLLRASSVASGYPNDNAVGAQYSIHVMSANHEGYEIVPVSEGDQYVLQYWVDNATHEGWVCIQLLDASGTIVQKLYRARPGKDHYTRKFEVPSGATQLIVSGRHMAPGYAYARMKLESGTVASDWSPAPEDVEADAVKRTQRIYYRTQSSIAPTAEFMPTAWVTETGDKWAAGAATLSNWTTKVTPISDGTAKYLYLFTCEQREMGDGTLLYTNVLLDDSTTVIDGGSIITGSVAANRIDAASGTFSTANIPALTADHIKANVIDAVNNGTGTINADKINVNTISIGDLDGADDYATKTQAQGYATTAQNAAAKTATNYVTAIDGKGIWVTPSNAKPDASGDEVAGTTSGWHIADALDLFRKGVSMFKVWVDETTQAVMTRIGASSMGHLLLEQSAIKLCDALDWVAKFSLSTNENGGEPTHTAALEINDGTEQGMHIGLNINHNTATNSYNVHIGTRTNGVGYSSGANGGASILADNVLLATDATDTVTTVRMADFIHAFGVTLFTGSYSDTRASVVTLSESAANFSMLRIICEDGDGQQTSTDVYAPNGKKVTVTMSTATDAYMYIKTKTFVINGTSIGCQQVTGTNSYYRHGQARIGSDGTVYSQSAELIGIVRVIGFY